MLREPNPLAGAPEPDIVEAILGGWADQRVMLERPMPVGWEEQRAILASGATRSCDEPGRRLGHSLVVKTKGTSGWPGTPSLRSGHHERLCLRAAGLTRLAEVRHLGRGNALEPHVDARDS